MADTVRYEAALSKGHSYSWEQQWEEAIAAFRTALEEVADKPAPYAGLGMAYFSLYQVEKALDNYKLASRYSRGDVIYLRQVAEMQERLGRSKEAAQTYMPIGEIFLRRYENVVEISPLDFSTRPRLVEMLRQHGQIDRSLYHYLALGEAYYQFAQVDKARETYQDALKLAPQGSAEEKWRVQLLRRIAEIDLQRFEWQQALASYRELRREDPADERAALTLIDLYFKVGQPNLALQEVDIAGHSTIEYIIRLNPSNVDGYRQLLRQLDQQAA